MKIGVLLPIVIGCSVLLTVWMVIEYSRGQNSPAVSTNSILPGQSVTKSFDIGQPFRVVSCSISANSPDSSLRVAILPSGNQALVNTSFTGELELGFTPKSKGLYDMVITNLGSSSVEATIEVSYLPLVGEKMADLDIQSIQTITIVILLAVVMGVLLTAVLVHKNENKSSSNSIFSGRASDSRGSDCHSKLPRPSKGKLN